VTILQLHQQHSMEQIAEAIGQALHHQCAHADGVQLCLNQLLTPALPAMTLDLQSRPQLLGIGEQVVNLAQYDALVGGVPCP
jgi:imidazoleglycerol phosphate dehydratase HisB